MPIDLEAEDVAQRRLQRLGHRYRRAQNALAGTRAAYASLREMPGANELLLQQARLHVERAQRELTDLHHAIELAEDWGYVG